MLKLTLTLQNKAGEVVGVENIVGCDVYCAHHGKPEFWLWGESAATEEVAVANALEDFVDNHPPGEYTLVALEPESGNSTTHHIAGSTYEEYAASLYATNAR